MTAQPNPIAPEAAAECHGVAVPMSPFLTDARIERINAESYEGQELAGALAVVKPGDRVLEMGAGLGIVSGVVGKNCAPAAVLSFEANPQLIPHIRALHALNGLNACMEVRNAVLLSAPDAPREVAFHVRKSYLGSSLVDTEKRQTTRVDVPTARYEEIHESFAPSVLLIDIEGGELDFLRHAPLDGVRAVVIEFHPGVYGTPAMRECKRILKRAGLHPIDALSSRKVWTCARQQDAVPPAPDGGWSTQVETLSNAIIVPPKASGLVQAAGVLDARGQFSSSAVLWRNGRALMVPPEVPKTPLAERSGTWLWGGVLWVHFGHFLVESLSRLWCLKDVGAPVDGILYVPKRPTVGSEIKAFQRDLARHFGWHVPLVAVTAPERVEQLIVAGQGFGLGKMSSATAPFRKAVAQHFARTVAPEGPEKLYISRSKLPKGRGGLIGERALEAHLKSAGYSVFHPQEQSIDEQIARYKAAGMIIAAEGSALHLLGMVAGPEQKIAVIVRRPSGATRNIQRQITAFTGQPPLMLSHLVASWTPQAKAKPRLWYGEIDFKALRTGLQKGGFLPITSDVWRNLGAAEVQEDLGPGQWARKGD